MKMLELFRNHKILYIVFFCVSSFSCQSDKPFEKLEYDLKKNYLIDLSKKLIPDLDYEYWAFIRSDNVTEKRVLTLFEKGVKPDGFEPKYFYSGFLNECHPGGCSYYILAVNNGVVNYVNTAADYLKFIGKINTKEEALIIARINEYYILPKFDKASSFRKTDDGFEFLLAKENMMMSGYNQHSVKVSRTGKLTSEEGVFLCDFPECE